MLSTVLLQHGSLARTLTSYLLFRLGSFSGMVSTVPQQHGSLPGMVLTSLQSAPPPPFAPQPILAGERAGNLFSHRPPSPKLAGVTDGVSSSQLSLVGGTGWTRLHTQLLLAGAAVWGQLNPPSPDSQGSCIRLPPSWARLHEQKTMKARQSHLRSCDDGLHQKQAQGVEGPSRTLDLAGGAAAHSA